MVGELVVSIRELYTAEFAEVITRLGDSEARVLSEVALRDRKGQPIRDGFLKLPMRLDLVSVAGGPPEGACVDPERLMRFEPVAFDSRTGMKVLLHPFQWDSMTVSFSDPGREDWQPLVEWFSEWYRENGDDDAVEGELLGVVHFLSDPKVARGRVRFTVDLGTAPVEAFDALLDVIASLGVTSVVIGDTGR